jgi:hypothetical protein
LPWDTGKLKTMVDAVERLEVLLTQESSHYVTSDYLSRMQYQTSFGNVDGTSSKKRKTLSGSEDSNHEPSAATGTGVAMNGGSDMSATSQINKQWRENICEWAYNGKDNYSQSSITSDLIASVFCGSFIPSLTQLSIISICTVRL